jgi:hypothetical protein
LKLGKAVVAVWWWALALVVASAAVGGVRVGLACRDDGRAGRAGHERARFGAAGAFGCRYGDREPVPAGRGAVGVAAPARSGAAGYFAAVA